MEEIHYISHHGIKGQKWGIRRYQNPDGSLKLAGKKRLKKTEKEETAKAKQKAQEERTKETVEQKRERLLKSSNAKELYENRNLLTTQELNERLQRIDTERRLGEVASKGEKSRMEKVTERLNKIAKLGESINNAYRFTESGAGKALKEAIFGKKDDDDNDARKLLGKDIDKLSTKQLTNLESYLQKKTSVGKLLKGDDDKDKISTLEEIAKAINDPNVRNSLSSTKLNEMKNTSTSIANIVNNLKKINEGQGVPPEDKKEEDEKK